MIIRPDGKTLKLINCYRGEDAGQHFLNGILYEKEKLKPFLTEPKPMNLTTKEKQEFK